MMFFFVNYRDPYGGGDAGAGPAFQEAVHAPDAVKTYISRVPAASTGNNHRLYIYASLSFTLNLL